jgi:hypothetical protein
VVAGERDEVVVALGLVSVEAAGHGEMVVQRLVVRAFVVPHSCPKCEGMNGPPEVGSGPPAGMVYSGCIHGDPRMHRAVERSLDHFFILVTLFVGIGIGILISPRLSEHVEAQAQAPTPAGASDTAPATIPLTNYMSSPALVSNVVLAHELEADHAVVNGYDLLLLDQNIINYLAKLPVGNGAELTMIGDRSKATTRYTLPPPKGATGMPGGPDGKQPSK